MTRGIVVCAHNNDLFRYTDLIPDLTERAARHLDIPKITVITDSDSAKHIDTNYTDQIIMVDRGINSSRTYLGDLATQAEFVNASRLQVYDLSPYDQTLVLDLDVIIGNSEFKKVWNSIPFQINTSFCNPLRDTRSAQYSLEPATKRLRTVYVSPPYAKSDLLNDTTINTTWATVFAFNKDPIAEHIFAMARHVRKNYDYFSKMFRLKGSLIRNDYCFAIAIHILGGFQADLISRLPFTLNFAWEDCELVGINGDAFEFRLYDRGLTVRNMNFHVMNKTSLFKALGL